MEKNKLTVRSQTDICFISSVSGFVALLKSIHCVLVMLETTASVREKTDLLILSECCE